jgi:hypothetical protein
MLRPDGVFGPLHLVGRGRDLLTTPAAEAEVLSETTLRAEVAYLEQRTLTSVDSDPPEAALAALVGERTGSGFRSRVDQELPDHRESESLLYQLLDDVTVAVLVSGYVLSTVPLPETPPSQAAAMRKNENVCAGWRSGGTIMDGIAEDGRPPMVTGPAFSALLREDDPLSWHELQTLPEHGMRRHRRVDIWPTSDGIVHADCFFRDSHMSVDGTETAIHEYAVTADLDAQSETFVSGAADPRVLPWVECPPAADSATRIAGMALADLRPSIRAEFTGTTTCTHLNDQLRSLAGVRALLRQLPELERTR